MAERLRIETPVWAFDPRPGGVHCAAYVNPEEYDFIMERGYVMIDGQRANVVPDVCERDDYACFLRLQFVEPWQPPSVFAPVINMPTHSQAAALIEVAA